MDLLYCANISSYLCNSQSIFVDLFNASNTSSWSCDSANSSGFSSPLLITLLNSSNSASGPPSQLFAIQREFFKSVPKSASPTGSSMAAGSSKSPSSPQPPPSFPSSPSSPQPSMSSPSSS